MDAKEAIMTRRSIRRYTKEAVPDEAVDELLHAAMNAPSACAQDPWHFVVIRDPKTLEAVPTVHPYAAMVPKCQAAILVCWDEGLDKHKGFAVQDCCAATENILLAAHARGLGAVWLGCHPRKEREDGLKGLLGIPDHVVPLALVPIGFPGERKGRQDRFRADRVHRERW
jgi:nitroreductase